MIRHIFGPVPSRRLGISLGVDITPYKTCTLDCIYCECGKTTDLRLERENFIPTETILEELREAIGNEQMLDYITFSGSGEPTLHKELGKIIEGIKKMTCTPIAVLTNGTLLHLEEVRRELLPADLVLPSLDAATPGVYQRIAQPHEGLDFESLVQGLIAFRKEYTGKIWLEVFIAQGYNDDEAELDKLHALITKTQPDKVQLNSLDRPPAYENILPVDTATLEGIQQRWDDLPVEVIKRIRKRDEIISFSRNLENNILNTIRRRPLAIDDLEALTGKKRRELFKYIDILEREKKIKPLISGDKIFFAPVK